MGKVPTLMQINRVTVSEVKGLLGRLRPVSEAGVESLLASIKEVGVMKDAIHVRKKKDGSFHLIAGAHRLEAAKRLGWKDVEAKVWTDVTDDWAHIMEIDDNLAGAEMNALDTAVFLARRKEIYERLHPETKAKTGAALAAQRWDTADTVSVASFAASTAEKFGLTDRHVRRMIAAGIKLAPNEVAELRAAPKAVTLKDLTEIGQIENTIERYDVVSHLSQGKSKSVTEALRTIRGASSDAQEKDPVDTGAKGISDAWKRAPIAARRRFVEEHRAALEEMLGSGPEGSA